VLEERENILAKYLPSDLLMTMISNKSLLKPDFEEIDTGERFKFNARGLDMLISPRPASSLEKSAVPLLKSCSSSAVLPSTYQSGDCHLNLFAVGRVLEERGNILATKIPSDLLMTMISNGSLLSPRPALSTGKCAAALLQNLSGIFK
jgi:hypothetical protein